MEHPVSIWADHVFFAAVVFGLPFAGLWLKKRLARAQPHELPRVRFRFYLANGFTLWLLVLAAISIWIATSRSWFGLGLVFLCTVHTWALLFAFLVILALSLRQYTALSHEPKRLIIAGGGLGRPLWLPSRPGEKASYFFYCASAAICEEVVYRAWLFWYLQHWFPVWVAGGLSAVLYGMSRSYRSIREIGREMLIGFALFLIYYVGAVYVAAAFHLLFSMQAARLTFAAIRLEQSNPELVAEMARRA